MPEATETVLLPEAEPVVEAQPEKQLSWAEYKATWTPEQQTHYRKTGEAPQVTKAVEEPKKDAAPSGAAKPEPSPEPDSGKPTSQDNDDLEEDQEFGDPKANKSFARLRRQKATFRDRAVAAETRLSAAEREIASLKEKSTAHPASAATAKTDEASGPTYLDDPKYQKEDGSVDVAAFSEDQRARTAADAVKRFVDHYNSEAEHVYGAAEKLAKSQEGFDEDAFSKSQVTWPFVSALGAFSPEEGASILAYLAAHPEESKTFEHETDVLSSEKSFGEALLRCKRDPDAAIRFGVAAGVARGFAREILTKIKAASQAPETKPRVISKAPAVGSRVTGTAAGGDAIEEATRRRDYLAVKELKNQRDRERDAGRKHSAW